VAPAGRGPGRGAHGSAFAEALRRERERGVSARRDGEASPPVRGGTRGGAGEARGTPVGGAPLASAAGGAGGEGAGLAGAGREEVGVVGVVGTGRRPPPAEPGAALAGAVARLALLFGREGGVPSVTLRLGLSLTVTLEQRPSGVEVSLHASRGLSALAERELPGLVAALRERRVRVARAGVYAGTRRPPGR